MVCYTSSGSTARRIARERPPVPLLAMSASLHTARRLGLLWGVHAVHTRDVSSFEEMVEKAKRMALRHQLAKGGDRVVLMAGIPFGTAGSTNVLHVVRLIGDELEPATSARRRRLSAAVSAGISSAISRARKPIGPTFLRELRAGLAVQPDRPKQAR